MEDSLSTLMQFVADHQRRECELRRLQNRVANENPSGYVGIVDARWSNVSQIGGRTPFRSAHCGTIPVSEKAPSNWHQGSNHPFVLSPEHDPDLAPKNEIVIPWIVFKITDPRGVLCIMPEDERIFIHWGSEASSSRESGIVFRASRTEQAVRDWISKITSAK